MTDRFEKAFADAFEHILSQRGGVATREHVDESEGGTTSVDRWATQMPAGEPLHSRLRPRMRWLPAAAAVLAAVGLVWGVLGPQISGSGVPAVPASSPGLPPATAVLSFDHDPEMAYVSVSVTLSSTDHGIEAEVMGDRGSRIEALGAYGPTVGGFWSADVTPQLTVAVIPQLAANVMSTGGSDVVRTQYVNGWDLTLVAVQHATGTAAGTTTNSPGSAGMVWQDYHGTVRNSSGHVVPSARLTVPGRALVVFRDEPLGVWGYIDITGSDHRTLPLQSEPRGTIYSVSARLDDDGYYLDATWLGMVPAGGTDPEPRLTTPNPDWTSARLGDTGPFVFMAFANRIKSAQKLVTSVTYNDSSGQRVTYQPLVTK